MGVIAELEHKQCVFLASLRDWCGVPGLARTQLEGHGPRCVPAPYMGTAIRARPNNISAASDRSTQLPAQGGRRLFEPSMAVWRRGIRVMRPAPTAATTSAHVRIETYPAPGPSSCRCIDVMPCCDAVRHPRPILAMAMAVSPRCSDMTLRGPRPATMPLVISTTAQRMAGPPAQIQIMPTAMRTADVHSVIQARDRVTATQATEPTPTSAMRRVIDVLLPSRG